MAEIVFIGEAPGEVEAKTGRPFVGPAGRVLDGLLADAGLTRDDIYITNVVKDRPPDNREDVYKRQAGALTRPADRPIISSRSHLWPPQPNRSLAGARATGLRCR